VVVSNEFNAAAVYILTHRANSIEPGLDSLRAVNDESRHFTWKRGWETVYFLLPLFSLKSDLGKL
jgi:hypothetical protein